MLGKKVCWKLENARGVCVLVLFLRGTSKLCFHYVNVNQTCIEKFLAIFLVGLRCLRRRHIGAMEACEQPPFLNLVDMLSSLTVLARLVSKIQFKISKRSNLQRGNQSKRCLFCRC